MIRGFLFGVISAVFIYIWARRQPARVAEHHHLVHPDAHIQSNALRASTEILAIIERESPWILKPNAKQSNNL